jgi:hypothetical protein
MQKFAPIFALLVVPSWCYCAERVDNVLARLVPADSTALFGARLEQLKTTSLYSKLVAQQKLSQLDSFAAETGFDPRRDVRDLLVASNGKPNAGVLLARGTFHVNVPSEFKATLKPVRYKGYILTVREKEDSGYCIMD